MARYDTVQHNFSGGQVSQSAKRREEKDFVKNGAAQQVNFRIEGLETIVNRPARRAVAVFSGVRSEYFRMEPGFEYFVSFGVVAGQGALTFYSPDGTSSAFFSDPAFIWTVATIGDISWTQTVFNVIVCFPGMKPYVFAWDQDVQTWTQKGFGFSIISNAIQEPFYRFAALGATMTYGDVVGDTTLQCSQDYFKAGHVGRRISILGQQVKILTVVDAQNATIHCSTRLPDTVSVSVVSVFPFRIGQIVSSRDQGLKFEVTSIDAINGIVTGTMLSPLTFDNSAYVIGAPDILISTTGRSAFKAAPVKGPVSGSTVEWLEEFMSDLRGWPARVSYLAGRLTFFGFPQLEEAILWSALGSDSIFWVDSTAVANNASAGALPNAAILEFVSKRPKVIDLVDRGGGDIFVFTDRGVYFIVVNAGTPLAPGNIVFTFLSGDGIASIKPIATQNSIVYINQGRNRVSVIRPTGGITTPYIAEDLSDAHAPLFTGPVAMAVATGDGQYPERYVYVVNADGTLIVGKFSADRQIVGWAPWPSAGMTRWVTAAGPSVWFSTIYPGQVLSGAIIETEDDGYYLDGMILLNAPPPGMGAAGLGSLWHLRGLNVTVMDGAIDYGDRQVDGAGNLVTLPTDDFSSPSCVAGTFASLIFTPFFFPPRENNPVGARGKTLRILKLFVTYEQSNGFTIGNVTIPPNQFGEDPTAQPVLRQDTYSGAMLGQGFDIARTIRKDRPGPLRIVEVMAWMDA